MGASPSREEAHSNSSFSGNGKAMAVASSASSSGSNQAQSKRAPALHMFQEIVAEKDFTASSLEDQIYTGIFLAGKTKVAKILLLNITTDMGSCKFLVL